MKIVKETLNELPTWDDILSSAPQEILDLIEESKNTPQGTDWHPEGEVYNHIRIVFERARQYGDIDLLISSLFHDLGKMSTTKKNKRDEWAAHGHERVSANLVKKYSSWIDLLGADSEAVYEIVNNHMRIKQMDNMRPVKQEQMKANPQYEKLLKFTEFDSMKSITDEEINRYK